MGEGAEVVKARGETGSRTGGNAGRRAGKHARRPPAGLCMCRPNKSGATPPREEEGRRNLSEIARAARGSSYPMA